MEEMKCEQAIENKKRLLSIIT